MAANESGSAAAAARIASDNRKIAADHLLTQYVALRVAGSDREDPVEDYWTDFLHTHEVWNKPHVRFWVAALTHDLIVHEWSPADGPSHAVDAAVDAAVELYRDTCCDMAEALAAMVGWDEARRALGDEICDDAINQGLWLYAGERFLTERVSEDGGAALASHRSHCKLLASAITCPRQRYVVLAALASDEIRWRARMSRCRPPSRRVRVCYPPRRRRAGSRRSSGTDPPDDEPEPPGQRRAARAVRGVA